MKVHFGDRHRFLFAVLLLSPVFLLAGCRAKSKPPTPETTAQSLLGEWQAVKTERLIQGFDGVKKIVFTSANEAWLVDYDNNAYKSMYWLEPNSQPMHIDILSTSNREWMTTFKFLDGDTIKILPHQQGLQQMRHPKLDSGGVDLQKISKETNLDQGVKVQTDRLPSIHEQERSANLYLNTLIFAQRDYYDGKRTFATQLSEMNPGFTHDFMGYRYQILPGGNQNLIIAAQPLASGLKSFSALLVTGEGYSSAITICQSKQPTQAAPTFVQHSGGSYMCAANAEDPGSG
ncbi:type IV pilin-like G/H family protein [Kovacikia minuta CCNUW1]|uniref:type IV pilin-like G/H family protein n=1 Tax=Kovacikia minuta TaxID=2931930 RepID=UPI001CCFA56C|nr:type IV pilin-like G/H family protein [Kovacikia minuta]UBF29449.1 type IV pilin-like G/H family protein [Kovacikia minuta CCNUW1]